MRAHQIMTRKVISVKPGTPITDAANIMLQQHISGLPVVNEIGNLVGIISEGDFIRRWGNRNPAETRPMTVILGWAGSGSPTNYVRERGRKGRRDHDARSSHSDGRCHARRNRQGDGRETRQAAACVTQR